MENNKRNAFNGHIWLIEFFSTSFTVTKLPITQDKSNQGEGGGTTMKGIFSQWILQVRGIEDRLRGLVRLYLQWRKNLLFSNTANHTFIQHSSPTATTVFLHLSGGIQDGIVIYLQTLHDSLLLNYSLISLHPLLHQCDSSPSSLLFPISKV